MSGRYGEVMRSASKGQSAIEYLMTYGWMLLVVAIVGGAIFATVNGQTVESTSGFSGSDLMVENFGVNSEGILQMEVRNTGSETVSINSLNVSDNGEYTERVVINQDIEVGDSKVVGIEEFELTSSSNSMDLEINYDTGGLSDLKVDGTITAPYRITRPVRSISGYQSSSDFLANFNGDTGDFAISSEQAYAGDTSIKREGNGVSEVISQSGLSDYPEVGDSFRYQTWASDQSVAWNSVLFGVKNSSSFYRVMTRPDENRVRIIHQVNDVENDLVSRDDVQLEPETWYTHEVEWRDDYIQVDIYDESEEAVSLNASTESISPDYDSYTGLGIRAGAGPNYVDYFRIIGD
jgi:hypothetical protein